ncbi:MAG: ABC transporter permease [Phycisphaerae bacterium]|nr:ABC transporter permease [Phycisphaerae bacterium]
MYKLFLICRYLRKRLIALCAVASVWLCVFMVIVVISVMGGFVEMVKEHSRGLLSDLIVEGGSLQGFPYYQEFIDTLLHDMPDTVESATPVIYNYGLLRITHTDFTKPIQVVGIRLGEYQSINAFDGSLYYDKYYPGITTLQPRRQPLGGLSEGGRFILPPEFEQAWARYQAGHPDDEDLERFRREPLASFRGPGLFDLAWNGPGYGGDEKPGAIIGVDLIGKRGPDGHYSEDVALGSELVLTVLPLTRRGTISGEGPIPIAMRYADRSRTKVYDIDKMCVYVGFDLLQRALNMEHKEPEPSIVIPARASQVLIKLREGQNLNQARDAVEALWQKFVDSLGMAEDLREARLLAFVGVETWEQRQQTYINAVKKEKILVTILFGVISLVAVVLIGCIFYMIVSHKTRDIGIIKSVGASSKGVAGIFLGFGLAVGVVGSFLGTVCAVLFVKHINWFQDQLTRLHPDLQVWSPSVYVFDQIPNTVDTTEVTIIVFVALVSSMLGALIPAIQAGRVWPVEALRYE